MSNYSHEGDLTENVFSTMCSYFKVSAVEMSLKWLEGLNPPCWAPNGEKNQVVL